MTRLLLAPAGHSKTERLIQRIRQLLAGETLRESAKELVALTKEQTVKMG